MLHHHHHYHHPHHFCHLFKQSDSTQPDNESLNSLDAVNHNTLKYAKNSSEASSDDPDLLEVLSLCDENMGDQDDEGHGAGAVDEDIEVDVGYDDASNDNERVETLKPQRKSVIKAVNTSTDATTATAINAKHNIEVMSDDLDELVGAEEDDEGQDDFEVIAPYCDCEFADGDISSASAGSSNGLQSYSSPQNALMVMAESTATTIDSRRVVLRRKYNASPIHVSHCGNRTVSLIAGCVRGYGATNTDTTSLPNSFQPHTAAHYHHHHAHAQLARKLQHLRDRRLTDRQQLSLALRQEPFQSLVTNGHHFQELPSPSSASLHSGHDILDTQELSAKSNSAPLLLKQEKRRDDFANHYVVII